MSGSVDALITLLYNTINRLLIYSWGSMDKEYMLREMRCTAKENNGIPLGMDRFEKETGIKPYDWQKHWARYSDFVVEAGFTPNQKQSAYDEQFLFDKLISLIREIGRFPTSIEIRLKANKSDNFPYPQTLRERLGKKAELINKLLAHCEGKPEYSDVLAICRGVAAVTEKEPEQNSKEADVEYGYVYLMKFQRVYKIGSSKNPERRNYELGTKLPEDLKILHKIRTDDPFGIEAYWHNRFKDKRTRGEYFALSPEDISSFRRRKFM
ncbi:MAG: GIY-YIG nuclease family protein [Chloroflexota bacterium]